MVKKLVDGIFRLEIYNLRKAMKKCKINIYFYNLSFSGGGCYDEEGQALKIGRWIDVDDGFS